LFAVAAGCSGGGSGGGSPGVTGPDLVQISSTNAKTISGAVLESSLDGGQLTKFTPTSAGGGATKTTATVDAASGPKSSATAKIYAKVASLKDAHTASLLQQDQIGNLQAAVGPETAPCMGGGTATLSGNIASLVALGVGDSITVDYADCDDGTTLMDGTFSMTITSLSGDLTSELFALGVDVTLTSFSVTQNGETVSANGGLSFLADSRQSPTITTTVTADSLTITDDGATSTLADFTLAEVVDSATTAYSISTEGTLTSTTFSGAVTFTTQTNLEGTADGDASSGELLITGAKGGTIHVIVLDAMNVRLELDLDGDGQVDQTLDATWDELA
jgi:hypothetical protein